MGSLNTRTPLSRKTCQKKVPIIASLKIIQLTADREPVIGRDCGRGRVCPEEPPADPLGGAGVGGGHRGVEHGGGGVDLSLRNLI